MEDQQPDYCVWGPISVLMSSSGSPSRLGERLHQCPWDLALMLICGRLFSSISFQLDSSPDPHGLPAATGPLVLLLLLLISLSPFSVVHYVQKEEDSQ